MVFCAPVHKFLSETAIDSAMNLRSVCHKFAINSPIFLVMALYQSAQKSFGSVFDFVQKDLCIAIKKSLGENIAELGVFLCRIYYKFTPNSTAVLQIDLC